MLKYFNYDLQNVAGLNAVELIMRENGAETKLINYRWRREIFEACFKKHGFTEFKMFDYMVDPTHEGEEYFVNWKACKLGTFWEAKKQ